MRNAWDAEMACIGALLFIGTVSAKEIRLQACCKWRRYVKVLSGELHAAEV